MDIAVAAGVTGAVCLLGGTWLGMSIQTNTVRKLREKVRAKDQIIVDRDNHVSDLNGELVDAHARHVDLTARHRELERAHGKAQAEIVRMKPLAERGERAVAQHRAASKAGAAARSAKRAAAKQANAAVPFVPPAKAPTKRKRA